MHNSILDQMLSDLRSEDEVRRISAFDRLFSLPSGSLAGSDQQEAVSAALSALESSANRFPVAERVMRFGEEVVKPLSELMAHTSSPEVRTLAALILLNKGSR